MKTLITGGAGFIGSHLTDKLLGLGYEVVIIDNLVTGKKENISHLLSNPLLIFHEDTILNETLLEKCIKNIDCIYHLAAPVGVKWIMEHPVDTVLENIRGIDLILRLANKYKKKILIASTSEVYGKNLETINKNNLTHKLSEEDDLVIGNTQNHRWAYANTKTTDELLGLAYYKEFKLPVIVVRFFNTVGTRQTGQYGMVLPNFIKSALKNEPITVYGSGEQTRCFTYVGDVVDGIIKLMDKKDAEGEVFNIGNDKEISIYDLAIKIKELTKSKSDIIYIDYEKAYGKGFEDMQRRTPDISKIRRIIGFSPTRTIEEIIGEMIEYYSIDKSNML